MGTGIRGRPPSAPARSDYSRRLPLRSRIAWLLRVNRLYGVADEWVSSAAFTAAFPGGCHPGPASESKISRWETGLIKIPYAAVRRYEELLGLPPSSLSSTVEMMTRYMTTRSAVTLPDRHWRRGSQILCEHAFDELLDLAGSPGTMTAAQWDDLTAALAETPGLRLRRKDWEAICSRLLVEMVTADGEAWKPRFEGFQRLLNHPGAQQPSVAVIASWVRCGENRALIEAVSLLDACHHPDAADAVLAQLVAPTNEDAFAGALLACVRKVDERHFTESQVKVIGNVCKEVLRGAPLSGDQLQAHAAATLARIESTPHGPACVRDLTNAADVIDARGPSLPPGYVARNLGAMIAARSISRLPREIPRFEDHLFPRLVAESLWAPISDTRLYAAFLLRSTPYRESLANAIAWAMGRLRRPKDPLIVSRFLEALRIVGTSAERLQVEGLAKPSLPRSIQESALQALGHMGGSSDSTFWREILAAHVQEVRSGNGASERLLNHAIYSMGIKRDVAELRGIADECSFPPAVRTAAQWWLNLPTHMFTGAEL